MPGRRVSSVPTWLAAVAALAVFGADGAAAQLQTEMELGGARLSVTAEEMRALSDLGNLARSGSPAFQNRALAEARRVVNGRDGRHALALYELEIGQRRGDQAMRAKALDALIASPLTPPQRLPSYLEVRGQIAFKAGDLDTAERTWSRLTPATADVLVSLARVREARQDDLGAADLLARAIATRIAGGGTAPEDWYRQRLSIAQRGKLIPMGVEAARALVGAYPSPTNWRDALMVYRQLTAPEGRFEVDLLRTMRRIGVLTRADEFQRLAQLLKQAGAPEEAKAVLGEGIARGLLFAATLPTREIIEEVDRAIAAPRRAASTATAGSAEAGVRQGMARIDAGRRAEAIAAFKAAATDPAGGRYAELAGFWLAWLAWERPTTVLS